MRWPTVKCILLACIATTIAKEEVTERPKRDLQFWKDLLTTKLGIGAAKPIQDEEPVQILRIPGFEKVVVKAAPKVTVVEAPAPIQHNIVMDPTMAVLQSYLGTQTPDQTLLALQNVRDILHSGIMKAREEVVHVMPPQQQILMLPPVERYSTVVQETEPIYPVYGRHTFPIMPQVVVPPPVLGPQPFPALPPPALSPWPVFPPSPVLPPQPFPVLPPQPYPVLPPPALSPLPVFPPPVLPPRPPALRLPTPVFPLPPLPELPPPPVPVRPPLFPMMPDIIVPEVPIPMPVKPLVPVPLPSALPLPTIPTKYSYKQIKGDGSAMSYSAKDKHAIVVQETNIPLPPPPPYIMDRFQKIIFGLPMGAHTLSPVLPIPLPSIPSLKPIPPVEIPLAEIPIAQLLPEPIPIVSRPSNVQVKVTPPNKKLYQGSFDIVGSKVIESPIKINEEIVAPKPVIIDLPVIEPAEPVIVEKAKPEDKDNPSYKRIHGDGSVSTYEGTLTGKDHTSVIVTEEISKMPSNPSYIADRIEEPDSKGKNKSMWGYAFKIASGVGSYETPNNDKIYYSRLSGAPKPGVEVLPDPLSSQDDRREKPPNKNIYYLDGDKQNDNVDKDEFGNPKISITVKGENKNKEGENTSELQPVKKFPPLPTPILGEIENSDKVESKPDTPKESIVISVPPGIDITKKSEGGFSYTQMNGDGSASTFIGNTKVRVQEAVVPIKKIPAIPSAIVDVIQPGPRPPVGVAVKVSEKHPPGVVMFAEPVHSRYVYKQISHTNPEPFTVVEVEDRPTAIPKGEVHVKVKPHHHIRPDGTRYLCSQVHLDSPIPAALPPAVGIPIAPIPPVPTAQMVPTIPGGLMFVPPRETVPINKPVLPSAIVDVVEHAPRAPSGVLVKVGERRPSGVIVAERVPSRYSYKQISHTNPEPFTVVEVQNRPVIEVPKGEVHVKVRKHFHVRKDGTKYPCTKVHRHSAIPVLPVAAPVIGVPIKPVIAVEDVSTYVSAKTSSTPAPSHDSVKIETSTSDVTDAKSETTTTEEPQSFFSRNPIVVAPEGSNYSYTQTNSDGSSTNVQGNKDNTVTVNVDEVKSSPNRGDIPDALA